jgi:hypothetical protein
MNERGAKGVDNEAFIERADRDKSLETRAPAFIYAYLSGHIIDRISCIRSNGLRSEKERRKEEE